MKVSTVYINTCRRDFAFAKICIASVRYWYPNIPICLIKDTGAGNFSTTITEKKWNVKIFACERKKFGWGYGKLEPLFLKDNHSFLVLDADTVLTGPVLNNADDVSSPFLVDKEIQPAKRFNEIYYNLERISEIDNNFKYPGYSFNSGQWFGTAGIVTRNDFITVLNWSEPPQPKYPDILFNGDQGVLNYILQSKEQLNKISICRKKIMIWPDAGNADFINCKMLTEKKSDYPYIIHWAGMGKKKKSSLPRADIIHFYKKFYLTRLNWFQRIGEKFNSFFSALKALLNEAVKS
jgi:hypothetical protein